MGGGGAGFGHSEERLPKGGGSVVVLIAGSLVTDVVHGCVHGCEGPKGKVLQGAFRDMEREHFGRPVMCHLLVLQRCPGAVVRILCAE